VRPRDIFARQSRLTVASSRRPSHKSKVRRAAGRNELDEAARKNALVPTYTIHHLVKERYPRFVDALGDLDDALTLSYLFAALPSTGDIKASVVVKAKNLVASWGAYCATTCCITRSFISVKGVYLEAVIQGTTLRWIVPHSFTQYLPEDVDYRVMMTFFEFYETLLNFVLFKLYSDIGLRYPFSHRDLGTDVVVGSTSAILATHLTALRRALDSSMNGGAIGAVVSEMMEQQELKKQKQDSSGNPQQSSKPEAEDAAAKQKRQQAVNAALRTLDDNDGKDDEDEDGLDVTGPLQAALQTMAEEHERTSTTFGQQELDEDGVRRKRLFAGLVFFLSREVPRGYLELVVLAFGGQVGWEGDDANSPIAINDPRITHHVVDRPHLPSSYGSLPKSREFIQPQWIVDCANFLFLLPVAKYVAGATLPPHLSPWVDNDEEGYKPAYAEEIERLKNGEDIMDEDDSAVALKKASMESTRDSAASDNEEGESSSETGEEDAEVSDADASDEDAETEAQRRKKERSRQADEEEAHALAKSMMSRKAAHLYGRMMHGKAQKKAKIDTLQKRRQEIEGKEKNAEGKTVLKQKVERLKHERKAIEKSYDQPEGTMKKNKKGHR
jgi:pescadillo protein